jgi:hypothetical protein
MSIRMMSRSLVTSGLLCLVLVGCRGESRDPVTVTDSAGIHITLSEAIPRVFAVVDPEPDLSLGGSEAEGPTQFLQIQNIHVDSEDRLWVADGQSGEIRLFLPDGSHWRTVGGRGEGPGEFQRLRLLGSFHGDSIAVWDNALARLTILDGEGRLARTQAVIPGENSSIRCTDVFRDGSLLGQLPTILSAGSIEPGQVLGDSAHIVRYDPADSSQRPWASALGPRWLWTGRNQVPIPFTVNPGFDLLGEALHLVSGTEFRVRVFEGGAVVRIYGIFLDPREVSDADLESYGAFVREFVPEQAQEDYRSALRHPDLPNHLPAYSRVLVTSSGLVWAQVYDPDVLGLGVWHVYDERGEWMGKVETPSGFWVLNVRGNRIAGVWRDEMGVEHVRVYHLRLGQEVR